MTPPPPASEAASTPAAVKGLTPPARQPGPKPRIGDMIVQLGFAEGGTIEHGLARARETGLPLGQALVADGLVSPDQLARALAERNGLEHVDLNVFDVDMGAANLIDPAKARRYRAVPVAFADRRTLLVALADPANVLALDDIRMGTGYEVRRAVAAPADIDALIGQLSQLEQSVQEIEEAEQPAAAEVIELRESADEAPVVKLVHSVIADAVRRGASDIHFQPTSGDVRVRFRIDGVVVDSTTVPRHLVAGLVSRVKIMADLDIAERRVPQDGRIGLTVDGRHVDLRVATLPVVRGEAVVMRILDKGKAMVDLAGLGMHERDEEAFAQAIRAPNGAVLVTGPTGSGKTTTLYAALTEVNTPEQTLIAIEDPVEYELDGVKQVQVNVKAGLTFASGPALDGALGPGRDHGRRGARPRDGADRDRVGAHRPPRADDAAHQRCPAGRRPPDRDGHRAVPGRGRHPMRGRPAAGAQAVRVPPAGQAVQGAAGRERLRARPGLHGS